MNRIRPGGDRDGSQSDRCAQAYLVRVYFLATAKQCIRESGSSATAVFHRVLLGVRDYNNREIKRAVWEKENAEIQIVRCSRVKLDIYDGGYQGEARCDARQGCTEKSISSDSRKKRGQDSGNFS